MKTRTFDVDIDVSGKSINKDDYGVRAFVYKNESIVAHPSGYYIDPVPVDPLTGLCAFDSDYGEEAGFQKIDLLSNSSYDLFSSKEEVLECMSRTPQWELLQDEKFVAKLPHIAKHADLLIQTQPHSISDLADVLALIRPGKIHLTDAYIANKKRTRAKLYKRSKGHYFKKAHAYSYAVMIVCVMNKLSESMIVF